MLIAWNSTGHDCSVEYGRGAQQNAALVEQAAAASRSMEAQASRMGTVVGRFQTAS